MCFGSFPPPRIWIDKCCKYSNKMGSISSECWDISGCKYSENCPRANKALLRINGLLSVIPVLIQSSSGRKYLEQIASEHPSAITAIQRYEAFFFIGSLLFKAGSKSPKSGGINCFGGTFNASTSRVWVAQVLGVDTSLVPKYSSSSSPSSFGSLNRMNFN